MSRRRTLLVSVGAACIAAAPLAALAEQGAAGASATHQMFVTYYGYWDNSPPTDSLGGGKHAGGLGTYASPITFASDSKEFPSNSIIYYPAVKKYFIKQDGCTECSEDWNGKGPDGGPGLYHVDLWLGGKNGNEMDAINCEDALTQTTPDGKPILTPVIVNPPNNEAVDTTPLFNDSTNHCYGGATATTTVAEYQNGSSKLCLALPGNASTSGTTARLEKCDKSAQVDIPFNGAFFIKNKLCLNTSSLNSGATLSWKTCNGGPDQQWSINPSGTITTMEGDGLCVRESGSSTGSGMALASCGTASNEQWATLLQSTTYEAESASNKLAGGAKIANCTACSNGEKVGYVGKGGTLTFSVYAASAGNYKVTVAYCDGTAPRTADVSTNGGTAKATSYPVTGGFTTPGKLTLTLPLKSGSNTITFSNPTGYAPDFDAMSVAGSPS